MSTSSSSPPPKILGPQFWSDLGLDYEAAFVNDPVLVAVVQKWLALLPSASNILECGSGTGKPIGRTIADSGHRYHGIDAAAGMVEISRKQIPEGEFEVVDMLSFSPDRQYDGIVASLSHFELSLEEHRTMYGHKARNFDPESGCAEGVNSILLGNKMVVTVFTQGGWKKMLEGVGFEIVNTEEDLFVPKAKAEDKMDEPRYYVIARKPGRA
ncbi:hypothetical protein G7Y79_00026g058610 [Physcia stellaris]|nr:hypothetical protein G7Y79_00026g058610 [Physcia stellaris]